MYGYLQVLRPAEWVQTTFHCGPQDYTSLPSLCTINILNAIQTYIRYNLREYLANASSYAHRI